MPCGKTFAATWLNVSGPGYGAADATASEARRVGCSGGGPCDKVGVDVPLQKGTGFPARRQKFPCFRIQGNTPRRTPRRGRTGESGPTRKPVSGEFPVFSLQIRDFGPETGSRSTARWVSGSRTGRTARGIGEGFEDASVTKSLEASRPCDFGGRRSSAPLPWNRSGRRTVPRHLLARW